MATKGLSLVGFLEEQQAIGYLQTACVPSDGSTLALSMEWKLARNNLGSGIPKAGIPKISDLPAAHQPYIDQLKNEAWQAAWFDPSSGWKVKLVSVDQLLSKQLHVDKDMVCQTLRWTCLAGFARGGAFYLSSAEPVATHD